jgi:RNA polymerase sigma factor (sigma-70 family)
LDPLEYYGLVIFLARQKHLRLAEAGVHLELDDLIQEGFLGLLDACRRFDARRRVSFSTFAYPRIAGAIEDYLRRLDPMPQRQRAEQKSIENTRSRLAQRLGREPMAWELAETAALSVEQVERAEGGQREVGEWGAVEPGDGLLALAVEHCLDEALDPLERQVLLLRARDQVTLKETGELVGRPLQTVFNIEQRARRKMRDCLEGQGWGLADGEG